jgi:hypothetical protein
MAGIQQQVRRLSTATQTQRGERLCRGQIWSRAPAIASIGQVMRRRSTRSRAQTIRRGVHPVATRGRASGQ